jgi:adenylate cyclase
MTATPAAATRSVDFGERLNRSVTFRVLVANGVGAVLVFVYLSLIAVGSTGLRTISDVVALVVMIAYVAVVFPVASIYARRKTAPVREWMASGRAPTAAERSIVLRLPGRFALEIFAYWVGAAVLFGLLSGFIVRAPLGRTIQIAATLTLGGMVTGALSYLLIERLNRPGRGRLGRRSIFVGIAVAPLGVAPGQHPDITGTAVFLSIVGLIAGAALTVSAARSVADPLASVRDGLRRVREGNIDVELTVDDRGDVGLLQAGFNQMVGGLRERRRLEDLFGRHVGAEVAQRALARGVSLGGEVRQVSALFVDIKGSTTMALERSPTEVVAILNAVFNAARSEGGWVNKFEGDAALCVFGAPGEQPDHAARALRAARTLRRELFRLAADHPGLDAGIGVSSGDAVAGNVGAEERYEYTVIGDPVNEAARLTEEAKGRPSRVLASGGALRDAGDEAAAWRNVGEVQLRGRAAMTQIYEPGEVV